MIENQNILFSTRNQAGAYNAMPLLFLRQKNQHNKTQKHETAPGNTGNNWTALFDTSYRLNYKYEGDKPHAPSTIIDEPNIVPNTPCCDPNNPEVNFANYGYDRKGNPLNIEKNTCSVTEDDSIFLWDEENRMRYVDTNPTTPEVDGSTIYTYDAGGERIIKQLLSSEILDFKNGLTNTVTTAKSITATIYPNGLLSAKLQYMLGGSYNGTYIMQYTKHYYAGTQRVTGKLGEGNNFGAFNCNWLIIPFGSGSAPINEKDKALQVLNTSNAAVLALMQSKGITPPPGFGQNAGYTGNCVTSYDGPEEKDVYWYHPDHLGSSSFITGMDGEG